MTSSKKDSTDSGDNHYVTHEHPVPPGELDRYAVDSDPHSEMDIANYVEGQAPNENVQHVEKVKREVVLGEVYDIWDVITDKGRWWVITNLTNLYSKKYFPSLDYTLSFHIGLMARLKSRSGRVNANDPSPFDEVLRRLEQASYKHDSAVEVEDYQVVGMLLREGLISLTGSLRRHTEIPKEVEHPQDANFNGWTEVLLNQLCGGRSNKELRQHLKNTAKEAWQLVNWLTHTRSATRIASSIAIYSCQTLTGDFIQLLERSRIHEIEECPVCKSHDIRTHYDISILPDGDYYVSCGVCEWTNHPGAFSD